MPGLTYLGRAALAAHQAPMAAGQWSAPGLSSSTAAIEAGAMAGQKVLAGRGASLDQLAVVVATAGSSGSLVRLGVHKLTRTASGLVTATLLVDAGTVDGASTGTKTLTLATPLAVAAGTVLWLTATGQGAPASQPHLHGTFLADPDTHGSSAGTMIAASVSGWKVNGVTGSLPDTPTLVVNGGMSPRVAFRCAA